MDKSHTNLSRHPMAGFTLIELMIILAIIALLATIANVSYTNFMRRSEVTQLANDFKTALHTAKNHAYTSGRAITVCGTQEIDKAHPACLSDLTDFNSSSLSQTLGWVVFYDADKNNHVSDGDKVFKKVPLTYRRTRMVWTGSHPVTLTPRNIIGSAGVLCVYSYADTSLYDTAAQAQARCLDDISATGSPLNEDVFEKRIALTTLGNIRFIQ